MKPIPQNNLFLIGPMAAGKSSIGRFLAKRTHKKFYDSDQEIEKRAGINIKWIYDLEGEAKFRQREALVIAELVKQSNIVLATGEGSVVAPESRKALMKHGLIIYLRISIESQLNRLADDTKRPISNGPERRALLLQLLQEREQLYSKIANFTIDTDHSSIAAVSQEIIKYVVAK